MKSTKATRLLARQVLEFIKQNPDIHEQDDYIVESEGQGFCGTKMCIAGTAAFLVNGCNPRAALQAKRKSGTSWDEYVGPMLGLDLYEASYLFDELDEKTAIKRLKRVAKGKPVYKT